MPVIGGLDFSGASTGTSGTVGDINGSRVISNIKTGITGAFNSVTARFGISGLPAGGGMNQTAIPPTIGFQNSAGGAVSTSTDWRVRIALSDSSSIFYKDSSNLIMQPLTDTNGVIFPYTPQINTTHSASYGSQSLTHSNYAAQFYQGSEVSEIQISGEFTVQDIKEGKYLLAAIYFFRASTKMFFGNGEFAGNPPPIVYLNGYGEHYFPQVPCVISSFAHTLPSDVDYIEVPISETTEFTTDVGSVQGMVAGQDFPSSLGGSTTGQVSKSTSYSTTTRITRLPVSSTISITLKPVYSRQSLHEKFNLQDFAAGKLINGNGNFL